MKDARLAIIAGAFWLAKEHEHCTYSEGSQRMSGINRPFVLPFVGDCSATVTDWYNWAGAPDPNKLRFDHEGYTGTLLSAGEHMKLWRLNGKGVRVEDVLPADVVIFGPGTGRHAALVVAQGNGNPVVASMGRPGDPSILRVSQLSFIGEQTYLRFDTMARHVHWPPGHKK